MDKEFFTIFIVPSPKGSSTGGEKSELTGDFIPPPVTNKIPPPSRQIHLRVPTSSIGSFFEEDLSEVVGLLFRGDTVLFDGAPSIDNLKSIHAATKKLALRSKIADMGGAVVGIYLNGRGHEECYQVYASFREEIEGREGVSVFDVFGDEDGLKIFLRNAQYRSASFEEAFALEERS